MDRLRLTTITEIHIRCCEGGTRHVPDKPIQVAVRASKSSLTISSTLVPSPQPVEIDTVQTLEKLKINLGATKLELNPGHPLEFSLKKGKLLIQRPAETAKKVTPKKAAAKK